MKQKPIAYNTEPLDFPDGIRNNVILSVIKAWKGKEETQTSAL